MNWQHVHLRLMSTLPVRTHRQPDPEPENLGYRGRPRHAAAATLARHEAIVQLDREGLSHQEIADRLRVTTTTVRNHLKDSR